MKKLATFALLVMFACLPSFAHAASAATPVAAVEQESPGAPAAASPHGASAGDPADYAARESAAPALGSFAGGGGGIYIGGSVVTVLLVVLLVVIIL